MSDYVINIIISQDDSTVATFTIFDSELGQAIESAVNHLRLEHRSATDSSFQQQLDKELGDL